MTDTKKAGASVPAQTPSTTKDKLDAYVNRTLEHLHELMESGNIHFPPDYSPENACKGAALALAELKDKDGNLAINVCTPSSIVNSIMGMCIDGLNVWKKQGYFIVYGKELHWQPSYFGNIAKAKRDADVKEVNAHCIYEGDEFIFEVDKATGRMQLIKHVPAFENIDNSKIKGAYAIVLFNDGTTSLEVMTISAIKKAWMQGFGGGNTKAHQNFTDEMCEKTVSNRAVKPLNATADDSEVLPEEEDDKVKATRDKKIEKGKQTKKELNTVETTYEEVIAPGNPQPRDEGRIAVVDEPGVNEQTGEIIEPGY